MLLETLSPAYLVEAFKPNERPVSLAEVQTVLTGAPGQPVLVEPKKAIAVAIREGVARGVFAVKAGGQTFTTDLPDEVLQRPDAQLVPVAELTSTLEPDRALAEGLVLQVTAAGQNLYPLRKLLELLQGHDVTVEMIVKDERGTLGRKRTDVEQLLHDYSVPFEWRQDERGSG